MAKSDSVTLTIPTKQFADAFSRVSKIAPARTTKEILRNVKLEITGNAARLVATDSETSIRCELEGYEADGQCEVLLPPGRLGAILGELHEEHLQLEMGGGKLWVRAGLGSEWQLSTEDAKEFPQVPGFDAKAYYTIAVPALLKAIERTIFATDQESTRYALGGVLVEVKDGHATLAATDSRRLAVFTVNGDVMGRPDPASQTIIPAKAMKLLQTVLSGDDAKIAVTANDIAVQCGRFTVSSQLVQGRFPDYRKVIPQPPYAATTVVAPFHSAIRQAQIVTTEESRAVDFAFSKGTLRLSSQAADVGQSQINLPIQYDAADMTISFDPRYIADMLRVLPPQDTIEIHLKDHESSALLTTGDGYQYVIMPLSRDR